MPSLLAFLPGCYAIRVYGRRWLKVTKAHTGETTPLGWRAITWTPKIEDAEKWMTRPGAERFIEMLRCPCEIVDLDRRSGMTPDIA